MSVESAPDLEIASRATGLLATFNAAGVLGYADVHLASRLATLTGETSEPVLLAVALAVRAVRQGSVCFTAASVPRDTVVDGVTPEELAALPWPAPEAWDAALTASPLVGVGLGGPADRPLRYVDGLVYLDRYWRQERVVAEYVDAAVRTEPAAVDADRLRAALARLFVTAREGGPPVPSPAPDLQRLAAVVSAHKRFSIVSGGPGTGKTTTVARLLAVLQDLADGGLRVALGAPTGKAAARLTEAVVAARSHLPAEDQDRLGHLEARTLHRLLGSRPGSRTRFRHDRDNRLPYDVVVVDEASMVSLTMMSRLVEALRPSCRLVLVGDPDQLSSVEVGAVLGDLVERDFPDSAVAATSVEEIAAGDLAALGPGDRDAALRGGVVRLSTVHRFSEEIQELAEAIRSGRASALEAVLARGHPCIELVPADPGVPGFHSEALRDDVLGAGGRLVEAARAGDPVGALRALDEHRVLCGHREGPYGVAVWAQRVEEWIAQARPGYAKDGLWYVGRPLLVTSNDYRLRLFNGDTGVVVSVDGEPRAAFRRDGQVDLLGPSRLSDVQTVHAMSVHRSQGSQFDRVTLVLPPVGSPLLTRELVYTAVTRAKDHVRIVGTKEALVAAIERPVTRASGLRG